MEQLGKPKTLPEALEDYRAILRQIDTATSLKSTAERSRDDSDTVIKAQIKILERLVQDKGSAMWEVEYALMRELALEGLYRVKTMDDTKVLMDKIVLPEWTPAQREIPKTLNYEDVARIYNGEWVGPSYGSAYDPRRPSGNPDGPDIFGGDSFYVDSDSGDMG